MWLKTEELRNALLNGYEKKESYLGIIHLFKDLKELFAHLFQLKGSVKTFNEVSDKTKIEVEVPIPPISQPAKSIPIKESN
jgi:hypothetical protein